MGHFFVIIFHHLEFLVTDDSADGDLTQLTVQASLVHELLISHGAMTTSPWVDLLRVSSENDTCDDNLT
jgi:hypothetical protein